MCQDEAIDAERFAPAYGRYIIFSIVFREAAAIAYFGVDIPDAQ